MVVRAEEAFWAVACWEQRAQVFIGFTMLQGGFADCCSSSPPLTSEKKLQLVVSAVWNYHEV